MLIAVMLFTPALSPRELLHCCHHSLFKLLLLSSVTLLCVMSELDAVCYRDNESQWIIDLPHVDTAQGAQQLLSCMSAFFELITQDQLPQFRQIQVGKRTAFA